MRESESESDSEKEREKEKKRKGKGKEEKEKAKERKNLSHILGIVYVLGNSFNAHLDCLQLYISFHLLPLLSCF